MSTRPPLPPFNEATARQKVRLAEDGWNSRNAEKVAMAYTLDTQCEIVQALLTVAKKQKIS